MLAHSLGLSLPGWLSRGYGVLRGQWARITHAAKLEFSSKDRSENEGSRSCLSPLRKQVLNSAFNEGVHIAVSANARAAVVRCL